MGSNLALEIDFEPPRLIFDDVADAISECMEKESAADIAKKFNRERKTVYSWRNGCGFHCDVDFICGLNQLGYDLKLTKMSGDDIEAHGRTQATKKLFLELLAAIKEDVPVERDIIKMRDTFEEVSNELNQVACTLELLLTCLHEAEEETPHREALTLLWRNLLVIRERMVERASDTAVWSAAFKAQKRLNNLETALQGGF